MGDQKFAPAPVPSFGVQAEEPFTFKPLEMPGLSDGAAKVREAMGGQDPATREKQTRRVCAGCGDPRCPAGVTYGWITTEEP